jgi:hypothetical protein
MNTKKMFFSVSLVFIMLNACAPASTPIAATDVSSNTAAIATVDQFYTWVNDARSTDDFYKPWDLLSSEVQCHPANRCDLSAFEERWWQSKVVYTLYDCGPNRVAAQELKYPREADPASAITAPKYWMYLLSEFEGRLIISEMDLIPSLEEGCVLVKESAAE